MHIIDSQQISADTFAMGTVVVVGDFDGVHLGHQYLIKQTKKMAKEYGLPVVVMVFEPQPLEFFLAAKAPKRITKLAKKQQLIEELVVDYLVVQKFNSQFANLSAVDFIQDMLVGKLNIKGIVIGHDFRFGVKRGGDYTLLQQYGIKLGFSVLQIDKYYVNDCLVSSSIIRNLIELQDYQQANKLLGHNLLS